MAVEYASEGLSPVIAFALVGALGVGSQWVAWRIRMPAIVLMLAAGLIVGPVLGIFDPARDIGTLMGPMISVAVAIILFEGGLTLNLHSLRDSAKGVRRLVFIGAPLGWLLSTLALRYGAGLSWESAAVFGGIMIITGPTVIAPLLRTAKLARRPAALLQWEAIINDPLGALAAVLAFEVVMVLNTATTVQAAVLELVIGITFASVIGLAGGYALSQSFKRAWVPEFMKVPVLFAALLGVFALADQLLHESGLLAVTVMGIFIANANLPSYEELRRFKEHATVLLVSGVFILLAASVDLEMLGQLTGRMILFVLAVVLLVRPLTVFIAMLGAGVPWREQAMVAFTGPRGVVLVAVSGLFGERLASLGVADGSLIPPLAFALVVFTVVLHGFTLKPLARALGLSGGETPGVLIVGGSPFAKALAESLIRHELPVLIADTNYGHLWQARTAGIPTFTGDILSEAAEHRVELMQFETVVAATDNDAYNTLVCTDLAPEFGRDKVFQLRRRKEDSARHQLPRTLGGKPFGPEKGYDRVNDLVEQGWTVRRTGLTDEFGLTEWRDEHPDAILIGVISPGGAVRLVREEADVKAKADHTIIALRPPQPDTPNDGPPVEPESPMVK
ncbi:cation:proton antiporter [Arenibacterium sp. CAU 1754]